MDIHRLLNIPRRPRYLPPASPRTPIREKAPTTTRTDRIRIKTALDWATPRTISKRYGYTIRQIHTARDSQITPRKKGRYGRKPVISREKALEIKEWLLSSPSHRHISFHHLLAFTPDLQLLEYRFEAIRTAM